MLGRTPDIEVVGTCSTGVEAIQQSIKLKPDILFLDKHISDCDFVQVVKKIRRALPQTRIIITQPYKDASPLSAINVEANAYIDKDIPAEFLPKVLRQIYNGDSYLSPSITAKFLEQYYLGVRTIQKRPEESDVELTEREIQVLRLIADKCLTNREIGKTLAITEGTVKSHLSRIMEKLNVHSRLQAALWVKAKGISIKENDSSQK